MDWLQWFKDTWRAMWCDHARHGLVYKTVAYVRVVGQTTPMLPPARWAVCARCGTWLYRLPDPEDGEL